jgi:hypothetical protein
MFQLAGGLCVFKQLFSLQLHNSVPQACCGCRASGLRVFIWSRGWVLWLVRPFHMAKHAVPALATELLTVPFIVNSGGLGVS